MVVVFYNSRQPLGSKRIKSSCCGDSFPENMRVSRRSLVAPQPTAANGGGGEGQKSSLAAMPIMVSILVLVIICSILYCLYCWRWRRRNGRYWLMVKIFAGFEFGTVILKIKFHIFFSLSAIRKAQLNSLMPQPSSDLPLMDLCTIQAVTNNFSEANKLGEGGFGPVYRGVISGGRDIAVKRLSAKSKQGSEEFKNEVELIAKLQHRNLVKMLGYCVEREEKLLIYEFLPNKSLDAFLFDPSKRCQLDWSKRHHIIAGVARGLLYLHEDSLLKVIHRDLKASNVLLDDNMNPKISDFGMAKIFEGEQEEVITVTGRVVGTFGYMAPEYAREGVFSVKSDVFSFGVLLLEILSGRRNGVSLFRQYGQTLLCHAWELWSEERAMEFMDPMLEDSYTLNEAWRCFHIGLLCIQETAEYRPTMSSVVVMLRSEQMSLPPPTEPPFYTRVREPDVALTIARCGLTKTHTINEVTITCIEPR